VPSRSPPSCSCTKSLAPHANTQSPAGIRTRVSHVKQRVARPFDMQAVQYAPGVVVSDSLTKVRLAALAAGPVQAMRHTPSGARAKSTDEPLRGDSPVSPSSSADCTASVAQCNQSLHIASEPEGKRAGHQGTSIRR
jgi:hypothetical protein